MIYEFKLKVELKRIYLIFLALKLLFYRNYKILINNNYTMLNTIASSGEK
jgi:hypothetical protein